MAFQFQIPGPDGPLDLSVKPGGSLIFVGANGGGKTRLAVFMEELIGANAHRISAHRALNLNPGVPKISEKLALMGMRTGHANEAASIAHRLGNRWSRKAATHMLNDFDFLVQALFADQSNISLETHQHARAGGIGAPDATKFEKLSAVWDRLLPHRKLHVTGDDIQVSIVGSADRYSGSEMSDGERAILYMIGQALVAADNSLLIVDEPELHVHRSIMSKLWDELEAARPDCAFVFITHDLEFAATRAAKKFVIREFEPTPSWRIEEVPDSDGFDEELVTLILGSRLPILFVEGNEKSLDLAVYRCAYPGWTVIPRGSCEEVIHAVATMRANASLTRISCGGVVDADGRAQEDIDRLNALGVANLPVSEIENLFLLPNVSRAIAETDGHQNEAVVALLNAMYAEIFATLDTDEAIESVAVRNCRRRIDSKLKKVDLSVAKTAIDLFQEFEAAIVSINVEAVVQEFKGTINKAIADRDVELLLSCYDSKSLLAIGATHLRRTRRSDFEGWLMRVLLNDSEPGVAAAIRAALPAIPRP